MTKVAIDYGVCLLSGGCIFSSLELSTFCQRCSAHSSNEESWKKHGESGQLLARALNYSLPPPCKATHEAVTECYYSHCCLWKWPCWEKIQCNMSMELSSICKSASLSQAILSRIQPTPFMYDLPNTSRGFSQLRARNVRLWSVNIRHICSVPAW